jgi:hypothetical protein
VRLALSPHSRASASNAAVFGVVAPALPKENFSLPTTVSDKVSCSDPKLNPEPYFKTRLKGGDYIGLAAAADGSFHAVWIDARDGAFRLYTSRIEAR